MRRNVWEIRENIPEVCYGLFRCRFLSSHLVFYLQTYCGVAKVLGQMPLYEAKLP